MVQEAARELAGRSVVVQVNTDENPQLAGRYEIRGIPAVLIIRGGTVIDRVSGAMTKDALLAWWRRYAV